MRDRHWPDGLQAAIECNLSILPMITYHVLQLIVDTLIADRWRKQGTPDGEPESEPASLRDTSKRAL